LKCLNKPIVIWQLEKSRHNLGSRKADAAREFIVLNLGFEGNFQPEHSIVESFRLLHVGNNQIEMVQTTKHGIHSPSWFFGKAMRFMATEIAIHYTRALNNLPSNPSQGT
jgi:hypothetical protein